MKIYEIIKKSIEIPGISIKRGEFSAELILKERDGKGSMTFFPLFPGVTLAYIFVNSPAWTAPDFHIHKVSVIQDEFASSCYTVI